MALEDQLRSDSITQTDTQPIYVLIGTTKGMSENAPRPAAVSFCFTFLGNKEYPRRSLDDASWLGDTQAYHRCKQETKTRASGAGSLAHPLGLLLDTQQSVGGTKP